MSTIPIKSTVITIISYLAFVCVGFAQKNDQVSVTVSARQIGPDSLNKQSVPAVEYAFPERIHDFEVDTVNNFLTLDLRGVSKNGKWLDNKGDVVRFSTAENRVLWTKRVFFQSGSIEQYGGTTLQTIGGKTYSLDNYSGEKLWEVQNSLLFVDRRLNTAIGYKLKRSNETLEGISLKDGQTLWERKVRQDLGWNDLAYVNDTTLLIAAAGLHSVNLKTGKGWDYEATTGKKDRTGSAVGTGLGLAAGVLTGMYSVTTGYDLIKNICSNMLRDSLGIYFASKTELVKLREDGQQIWKTALSEDESSKSAILIHKGSLVMINWGYAERGQQKINMGRPFIASFNLSNGETRFKTIVSNDKESILDFALLDDEIAFVFDKRLEKYSLKDGRLLTTKAYNTAEVGELRYFLGDRVFVKSDKGFASLKASDPQKLYVYTASAKTLILDRSLNIVEKISIEDPFLVRIKTRDISVLSKRTECAVINKNGELLLTLPATSKVAFLRNKLYATNENRLLEIDLKNLLLTGN